MNKKVTNIKQYIPSTKINYDLIRSPDLIPRININSIRDNFHLSGVSAKNFKSLEDLDNIDINKINLIYGQNSAGKSSLIQSMLVSKRNDKTLGYMFDELIPNLNFLGNTFDVGGFEHCVKDHDLTKDLSIGSKISNSSGGHQSINFSFNKEKLKSLTISFEDSNLDASEVKLVEKKPTVTKKLKVSFSGKLTFRNISKNGSEAKKIMQKMAADRGEKNRFKEDEFYLLKCLNPKILIEISPKNKKSNRKEIFLKYQSLYLSIPSNTKVMPYVPRLLQDYMILYGVQNKKVFSGDNLSALSSSLVRIGEKRERNAKLKLRKDANLDLLSSAIVHAFVFQGRINLTHIPPIRGIPGRGSIQNNRIADPAVKYMDDIFSRDQDKLYTTEIKKINADLQKLGMNYMVGTSEYFQLGRKQKALVLREYGRSIDLGFADVGKGVSQVLPILVASAIEKYEIILIEQPEIHLHPKLQADVIEVISDSAIKRNNRFIIETHSENLLLRLQKKVRKNELDPNDINIYYFEKLKNNKINLVNIKILEDGSLSNDFPEGFFDIALSEILD